MAPSTESPLRLPGSSRADRYRSSASRRPLIIGAAVAAVLVLTLIGWGIVSAAGLLKQGGQTNVSGLPPKATATAQPTATPQPTATNVPATATPNIQAQLNQEAAASFSGITVSSFDNTSCNSGSGQSHFSVGQSVYFNLCGSPNGVAGPATIAIKQGGAVVQTLASGVYIGAGSHYFRYTYGLSAGTYDMVVTLQINGQTGVARDIRFTVG